jgi:hypothetical protein
VPGADGVQHAGVLELALHASPETGYDERDLGLAGAGVVLAGRNPNHNRREQ